MRPKFNHEWLEFLCPFGTAAHPDTRRRVESRWVGLGWVPEFLTYPTLGWVPIFDNPTYPTTRWVRVTRRVSPTGRGLYPGRMTRGSAEWWLNLFQELQLPVYLAFLRSNLESPPGRADPT